MANIEEKSVKQDHAKKNVFPSFQRRRLSVPDTIMRKHVLLQEQLNLQEYKTCGNEMDYSSDSNLNRRKDNMTIRKSILLRTLCDNNSKTNRLSGSFQEWQYSYGKLSSATQSLNSSPERLPKIKSEILSPLKKSNQTVNKFLSSKNNHVELLRLSPKRKISAAAAADKSIVWKKSSLTEDNSTKLINRSNQPISNFVLDTNLNTSARITPNNSKNDENSNRTDSGVQTRNMANLNVISNISLSQTTLNVIYKEVMKEVNKVTPTEINFSYTTAIYDDSNRIVTAEQTPIVILNPSTSMTTNAVQSHSSNSKTNNNLEPSVPLPPALQKLRATDMNASEEDRYESDSTSFVDSLEDSNSPKRQSSQPLIDRRNSTMQKVPFTFYIPIDLNNKKDTNGAVSEHFPIKLRDKLNKRQQKREEKSWQYRHCTYQSNYCKTEMAKTYKVQKLQNCLSKKRLRPFLPSIESMKHHSTAKGNDPNIQRNNKLTTNMENNQYCNLNSSEKEVRIESENSQPLELIETSEMLNHDDVEISHDRISKSKIPISVDRSRTHMNVDKPIHSEFDPNVEQLERKILINSLNHNSDTSQNVIQTKTSKNNETDIISDDSLKNPSQEYERKLRQSSSENISTNDNHLNNTELSTPKNNNAHQYKALSKDIQTMESSSDEGIKCFKLNGKNNGQNKRNFIRKSEIMISSVRSSDAGRNNRIFDSNSASLKKCKNFQKNRQIQKDEQSKKLPGEWSVTISGQASYGQMIPDVKMRIKFPNINERQLVNSNNQNYYSDSSLKQKKFQKLPKLDHNHSAARIYRSTT